MERRIKSAARMATSVDTAARQAAGRAWRISVSGPALRVADLLESDYQRYTLVFSREIKARFKRADRDCQGVGCADLLNRVSQQRHHRPRSMANSTTGSQSSEFRIIDCLVWLCFALRQCAQFDCRGSCASSKHCNMCQSRRYFYSNCLLIAFG